MPCPSKSQIQAHRMHGIVKLGAYKVDAACERTAAGAGVPVEFGNRTLRIPIEQAIHNPSGHIDNVDLEVRPAGSAYLDADPVDPHRLWLLAGNELRSRTQVGVHLFPPRATVIGEVKPRARPAEQDCIVGRDKQSTGRLVARCGRCRVARDGTPR